MSRPNIFNADYEYDDDADPQNSSLHPFHFYTRTADPPVYKFTAPADGKYLVAVGSHQASAFFGPRSAYRLRVAPPKPDFRAVVMPFRLQPVTTLPVTPEAPERKRLPAPNGSS